MRLLQLEFGKMPGSFRDVIVAITFLFILLKLTLDLVLMVLHTLSRVSKNTILTLATFYGG